LARKVSYTIELYRSGDRIGSVVSGGTIEATKQAALTEMAERGADFVRILETATGTEIWSQRRDA